MLPITHDQAARVREALAEPHDHARADCSVSLVDGEGQVLHRQHGLATPQDAAALGTVLLHSTPRGHLARVEGRDGGEPLAVVRR
jgi:hypothetical protein